jgi:hypothetical protein
MKSENFKVKNEKLNTEQEIMPQGGGSFLVFPDTGSPQGHFSLFIFHFSFFTWRRQPPEN